MKPNKIFLKYFKNILLVLLTTPPLALFIEPRTQQFFSKCFLLRWLGGRSCCMQSTTGTTAPPDGAGSLELSRFSRMDFSSMDCSPPGSSVHGVLQARILEWVAISFSRESSQPRDQTCVSWVASACWFSTANTKLANPGRRTSDWTFERHAPFWSLSVL